MHTCKSVSPPFRGSLCSQSLGVFTHVVAQKILCCAVSVGRIPASMGGGASSLGTLPVPPLATNLGTYPNKTPGHPLLLSFKLMSKQKASLPTQEGTCFPVLCFPHALLQQSTFQSVKTHLYLTSYLPKSPGLQAEGSQRAGTGCVCLVHTCTLSHLWQPSFAFQ